MGCNTSTEAAAPAASAAASAGKGNESAKVKSTDPQRGDKSPQGDPNWDQDSTTQTLSRIATTDDDETLLQGGWLFKTLPATTTALRVDLQRSLNIGDETLQKMARSIPQELTSLELNLNGTGGGTKVTDTG